MSGGLDRHKRVLFTLVVVVVVVVVLIHIFCIYHMALRSPYDMLSLTSRYGSIGDRHSFSLSYIVQSIITTDSGSA